MPRPSEPLAARLASEFLGTFALVLVGTGAIVVDAQGGGAVSPLGIALAFGLTVMVMIHAVGDISGAHFNPAVSLGFWLAGGLPAGAGAAYVASQCAGALAASGLLAALFPEATALGATLPAVPLPAALAVEVAITFLLAFTILSVTAPGRDRSTAALAIGAAVVIGALFGGPLTGGSMNPARSLGPALVSGSGLAQLWIYWTAPFAGAACAVLCCRCTRPGPCCRKAPAVGPGART